MNEGEERPLAHLNNTELKIAMVELRGDLEKEVVRLEGLLSLQSQGVGLTDGFKADALAIARAGSEKHFDTLNDHTAKLLTAHTDAAKEIVRAQSLLQSIDAAGRDKKEIDARLGILENQNANLQGRLWLPLVVVAAMAAGLAAAAVKLLLP